MKVNLVSKFSKNTGKINMQKDIALLDKAIEDKSDEFYLRFYGWEPKCLSLGRNQNNFETDIKIDTVKRPTGGRALLHDDEITYAIIGKIPENQSVIETYKMISERLIKGFKMLDIELELGGEIGGCQKYCMNISSGADISYRGKKFIGSAQYRKQGYFLQHGSILKSLDYDFLEKLFKEKIERGKIITLNEINPNLSDNDIIDALIEAFK